jgi:hypothetical protein
MNLQNFFNVSCVTSIELSSWFLNSIKSLSYSYSFTWSNLPYNSNSSEVFSNIMFQTDDILFVNEVAYHSLPLTTLFAIYQSIFDNDECKSLSWTTGFDYFLWVVVIDSSSVGEWVVCTFVNKTSSLDEHISWVVEEHSFMRVINTWSLMMQMVAHKCDDQSLLP